MKIEVYPATAERFGDVRTMLAPKRKDAPVCWCLANRLTNAENRTLLGEDRPQRLLQLCDAELAPGVLAYVDGDVAGWCGIGRREEVQRLHRSRTIPHLDHQPVLSVVCLKVRAGYRGTGVSYALVEGVVEYAASQGLGIVEAYPVETHGEHISPTLAYMGTTKLFEAAGFRMCAETTAKSGGKGRVIMRRTTDSVSTMRPE